MDKLYIGISGKMGSGKTTLTNNLIKALSNLTIDVVSLATPIKDLQDTIYEQLDMIMKSPKDRDLLIALGMWGRGKDPDFWLKNAEKLFRRSSADIVICDDVRFQNEADWFNEYGLLLRIEGEQRGSNVDTNLLRNPTEIALDNYPFDNRISNLIDAETTATSALYIISQHLNLDTMLVSSLAQNIREG